MNESSNIDYAIENLDINLTGILGDIESSKSSSDVQVKTSELEGLMEEFEKLKASIPKSKTLEIYKEYIDTEIEYIKTELEGYYPGNWDVQFDESVWSRVSGILNSKYDEGIEIIKNSLNSLHNDTLITIYIHFPEITITNSRRNSRLLRDFFIRITLNPNLASSKRNMSSYFHGWRATKTVSEVTNSYGHSHLYPFQIDYNGGDRDEIFGYFCLGSTEIASNSSMLIHSYNQDNFSLMLQQIKTYVPWESLEGGPYRKMAEINSSGRNSLPGYSQNNIKSKYTKFLEKYKDNIPFTVSDTGILSLISISEGSEFHNMVKDICDNSDLVYEEANGTQYLLYNSGYNASRYNTAHNNRERFKFKGESVKFKCIDDEGITSEPPSKVNKNLLTAIKNNLEQAFNNIIIDEYCNNK